MDSELLVSLPVIILLSVLSLLWFYHSAKSELNRVWDNFVTFGDATGLHIQKPQIKFFSKLPEIKGVYKNFSIRVFPHKVRTGSSTKTKKIRHYTRLYVFVSGTEGFTMQICREGFLDKAAKAFGAQDVQTGNEAFDNKFRIKSSDPELAIRICNDEFCAALLSNYDSLKGYLSVDANKIDYEENEFMTSPSKTERFLNILDVCVLLGNSIQKNLPSQKLKKQL